MRNRLRYPWLEGTLLGTALLLVLFTMAATVVVALGEGDDTADLTFQGTVQELATMLDGNPDRLIRLESAAIDAGGAIIRVDTAAIVVDPAEEPAFANGGFLNDQIKIFNDHAIRQAVSRQWSSHDESGRNSEAASLFRTVQNENGERRFSDRPNAQLMTVLSPYAEQSWREVRTADWQRRVTLLGYDGLLSVDTIQADNSSNALNGRLCTARRQSRRVLVYCESGLASDAGRFYDIGIEHGDRSTAGTWASMFTYRRRQVWRNGAVESLQRYALKPGDMFDIRHTGPFTVSTTDFGTLAASQWINGRQTFANANAGTVSFFARAGRSTNDEGVDDPVVLTFDAALSAELETC